MPVLKLQDNNPHFTPKWVIDCAPKDKGDDVLLRTSCFKEPGTYIQNASNDLDLPTNWTPSNDCLAYIDDKSNWTEHDANQLSETTSETTDYLDRRTVLQQINDYELKECCKACFPSKSIWKFSELERGIADLGTKFHFVMSYSGNNFVCNKSKKKTSARSLRTDCKFAIKLSFLFSLGGDKDHGKGRNRRKEYDNKHNRDALCMITSVDAQHNHSREKTDHAAALRRSGKIQPSLPRNDRRQLQNEDVISINDDSSSDSNSIGRIENPLPRNDCRQLQNEDVIRINDDSSSYGTSIVLVGHRRAHNNRLQTQNELSRHNIPAFRGLQNAEINQEAVRQLHYEFNHQEFPADDDRPFRPEYLYDRSAKSNFIQFLFQCSGTFCSNIDTQIGYSMRIGAEVKSAKYFVRMWTSLRVFAGKNPCFDERNLNLGAQRKAEFVVFLKDNKYVTRMAAARMPWLYWLYCTNPDPDHHNFQLQVWQNERGMPLLMKEAILPFDLDRPNM